MGLLRRLSEINQNSIFVFNTYTGTLFSEANVDQMKQMINYVSVKRTKGFILSD
jgi:hypothetical protein